MLLIVFVGAAGSEKFAEISLISISGTFRTRQFELTYRFNCQDLGWLYIVQRQYFIGPRAVSGATDHARGLKNSGFEP